MLKSGSSRSGLCFHNFVQKYPAFNGCTEGWPERFTEHTLATTIKMWRLGVSKCPSCLASRGIHGHLSPVAKECWMSPSAIHLTMMRHRTIPKLIARSAYRSTWFFNSWTTAFTWARNKRQAFTCNGVCVEDGMGMVCHIWHLKLAVNIRLIIW